MLGFRDQVVELKWARKREHFKGEKLELDSESLTGANIQN
jgi:hypothetical protein